MWEKGGIFMPCTEAYKEHIMYTVTRHFVVDGKSILFSTV